MSNPASSSPLPSDTSARPAWPRRGEAICWALAVLWTVILLARFLGAGPEDSVAACRSAIYRDPVTGREQGIGSARVARNGAMTCHGVTYGAGPR